MHLESKGGRAVAAAARKIVLIGFSLKIQFSFGNAIDYGSWIVRSIEDSIQPARKHMKKNSRALVSGRAAGHVGKNMAPQHHQFFHPINCSSIRWHCARQSSHPQCTPAMSGSRKRLGNIDGEKNHDFYSIIKFESDGQWMNLIFMSFITYNVCLCAIVVYCRGFFFSGDETFAFYKCAYDKSLCERSLFLAAKREKFHSFWVMIRV